MLRLNKYDAIVLSILKDSSNPLPLNELQSRFWNKVKGADDDSHSVGTSITNLYLHGFILKVEQGKGYYLSTKGNKACKHETA